MDMGSLAAFLPMLQQMMSQNRPPVATPGINPMAQMPQQPIPMGVPFGQMPMLGQTMATRTPTPVFTGVNPMGTGGLSMYKTATNKNKTILPGLNVDFTPWRDGDGDWNT